MLALDNPKFVDKVLKKTLLDASMIVRKESDTEDKSSFAVLSSNEDIASYVASNNLESYLVCNVIVSTCSCI